MFTMVASVLHLGNVTFEEDDKDAAYIQDMAPVDVVAVSQFEGHSVIAVNNLKNWTPWTCAKVMQKFEHINVTVYNEMSSEVMNRMAK